MSSCLVVTLSGCPVILLLGTALIRATRSTALIGLIHLKLKDLLQKRYFAAEMDSLKSHSTTSHSEIRPYADLPQAIGGHP